MWYLVVVLQKLHHLNMQDSGKIITCENGSSCRQIACNFALRFMFSPSLSYCKYDRGLIQFRRQTLHWLDIGDRIRFRLCIQVYKCQHSMAPRYLAELCKPISNILVTGTCGQLDVPRVRLSTYTEEARSVMLVLQLGKLLTL